MNTNQIQACIDFSILNGKVEHVMTNGYDITSIVIVKGGRHTVLTSSSGFQVRHA